MASATAKAQVFDPYLSRKRTGTVQSARGRDTVVVSDGSSVCLLPEVGSIGVGWQALGTPTEVGPSSGPDENPTEIWERLGYSTAGEFELVSSPHKDSGVIYFGNAMGRVVSAASRVGSHSEVVRHPSIPRNFWNRGAPTGFQELDFYPYGVRHKVFQAPRIDRYGTIQGRGYRLPMFGAPKPDWTEWEQAQLFKQLLTAIAQSSGLIIADVPQSSKRRGTSLAGDWFGDPFLRSEDREQAATPVMALHRKSLFAELEADFAAEPFEDGMDHEAENTLARAFAGIEARYLLALLTEFCTDITRPNFAASILRCLGRLNEPGTEAWRTQLISEALARGTPEIRDAAVQAVEQWDETRLAGVLKSHKEQLPWLQDYIVDVLQGMEG